MFPSLLPCHSVDGKSVDPEKGKEADEGHAEDDTDDDARANIRILAGIVGELPPKMLPLLPLSRLEDGDDTLQPFIDILMVRPRCGVGSLAEL
jgi:hypothetical protein